MNHRCGLDRSQSLLFPETLEEYVGPENPVRFLDAFVAGLDLRTLGFAHAVVEPTGRPPYDPATLLKRPLQSGPKTSHRKTIRQTPTPTSDRAQPFSHSLAIC